MRWSNVLRRKDHGIMEPMAEPRTDLVRVLGDEGEVSLGKEYAGRTAVIEEIEPGVWMVKLGEPVPKNELWLHTPEVKAVLDRALAWSEKNPPQETDLDQLEERLLRGIPGDSTPPRPE